MLNEILTQARAIYGNRTKDEHSCIYCEKYIGFNSYCDCIQSQKINKIAKRINEKAKFLERLKVFDISYDPTEQSNVPLKYANVTLNDYKARDSKEKAVKKIVERYQDEIIKNWLTGKNLLLIGNYGTAKSLIKSALCNHCTNEKKLSARYINITELTDKVKSTFSDGTPKTTEDIINEYVKPDYLFLDDLDKEKPTEFVRNLIYKVIDRRYSSLRPTVISSNTDTVDLDSKFFGEATISRLVENADIVYFEAENERFNAA